MMTGWCRWLPGFADLGAYPVMDDPPVLPRAVEMTEDWPSWMAGDLLFGPAASVRPFILSCPLDHQAPGFVGRAGVVGFFMCPSYALVGNLAHISPITCVLFPSLMC